MKLAAMLLGIAVAACGGGGPKVVLRYHPPPGAVYHFGVEQRTWVSADSGPMARLGRRQMLMRVYFMQTIKGPASGGTQVDVKFETVTMEIPGISERLTSSALAGIQGMRGTLVLDDRGAVVRNDFAQSPGVSPDVSRRLGAGISSMAYAFPAQPVGPGDSWTVTTQLPLDEIPGMSASATELARTTVTLREIRVEGSDTSVVLDIKTEFPHEPIRLTAAGETATIKLEGGIAGHQVFSLSRGAVVDATMKGTTNMTLSGGPMGSQAMSMKMEQEHSMVLLPN